MSRFTFWGGHFSPAMCDSTSLQNGSLQNGLRVLVVDSDLDSCEFLVVLLAQYGIETAIAACASEAIAQICQAPPDLLISEIFLPGEDGYSLMRQVKTLETQLQVKIPAIALTTVFAGEHDRIYSLTAGFCKHLSKPLNVQELIAAIASLTRLQPLQQMPALRN